MIASRRCRSLLATALLLMGTRVLFGEGPQAGTSIDGNGIRLEFDRQMHSRVFATFGNPVALGPFLESETLLTSAGQVPAFVLENRTEEAVADALGAGQRVALLGRSGSLVKRIEITRYVERPRFLFFRVRYLNEGREPVSVLGFTSHRYAFDAPGKAEPAFWSYQSGSYEKRPD